MLQNESHFVGIIFFKALKEGSLSKSELVKDSSVKNKSEGIKTQFWLF
jgi:hypothetical protein